MDIPDDDFDELSGLPPSPLPKIFCGLACAVALVTAAVTYGISEDLAASRRDEDKALARLTAMKDDLARIRAGLATEADREAFAKELDDFRRETEARFTALQAEMTANAPDLAEPGEPRPPDTADGRPLVEK